MAGHQGRNETVSPIEKSRFDVLMQAEMSQLPPRKPFNGLDMDRRAGVIDLRLTCLGTDTP
ncbi:hypothetical protein K0M31_010430 [Melipona bicolor]|uniref:Uncharacterized protein n=1 Tax=Melipona bicolor TaxID=60889 RepID=A0AA40KIJ4_9HYME|nr:hypothetical protein K0M31_010430 [Melipona bicolor]